MKRPMRKYRPSPYSCERCRGPIVPVEEGWQHVRQPKTWHKAQPAWPPGKGWTL